MNDTECLGLIIKPTQAQRNLLQRVHVGLLSGPQQLCRNSASYKAYSQITVSLGQTPMMVLFNPPANAMLIVWAQLACGIAKHESFPHFPHVSIQMSGQGGGDGESLKQTQEVESLECNYNIVRRTLHLETYHRETPKNTTKSLPSVLIVQGDKGVLITTLEHNRCGPMDHYLLYNRAPHSPHVGVS